MGRYVVPTGATAYTTRTFVNLLREPFLERGSYILGTILNGQHYFLWNYLKTLVYTNCPKILGRLKDHIRASIANMGTQIC